MNDFVSKVSYLIVNGIWVLPSKVHTVMIEVSIDVDNFPILVDGNDYKIWDLD